MIKSKTSVLMVFALSFIMLCLSLLPSLIAPIAVQAGVVGDGISTNMPAVEMQDINVENISPMAVGTVEKRYVYDADENKLMYNRVTGMVFSSDGVVYSNDSQPLTYNDETEQFEDSLQRRLDLVERSTGGLQNYYLMFGEYKVRSIGISDTLYIGKIKANTAFNTGAAYDMLVTKVRVYYKWYEFWHTIGGRYYYDEYYDLHGHKIAFKYFDVDVRPNLISGAGTTFGGGFVGFEKWGTILDLLDEIVYLMELAPPSGVMGEFALDTVTGEFLRDDRLQKIRINDGQLIDPMGWPLIGKDARPLWWRENIRAYTNHKGELLEYGEDNLLKEKSGFVAHSVISNVLAGQRIYIIYLADGVSLIPATLKTISTNPYKADYYDMNGKKINLDEIVEPDISVDDREDNWPEEFESTFWEKLAKLLRALGMNVTGDLLRTVFIVILSVILLIIISPLLPFIFSGIAAIFNIFFKLISMPFKALKKRKSNKPKPTKTG